MNIAIFLHGTYLQHLIVTFRVVDLYTGLIMQLQGSKFILRNWQAEDAAGLSENANNYQVSCYLSDRFPFPYTLAAAEKFIEGKLNDQPVVNFAIVINNEIAGGIGLEQRGDIYRRTPLIGYWLAEHYWGQGIMPEAVKLVTDYAFTELNAVSVVAVVFHKNPQSMRVLEKAGYTKQGIIRQSVIKRDEVMDEHVYAISRQ